MTHSLSEPVAWMCIYSGQPDPKWTFSIDDWKALRKLVQALPNEVRHQGSYESPSVPGYRGFEAIWNNYQIVYNALEKQAVIVNPKSFEVYNDSSKSIETWFLNNANKNSNLNLHIPK